MDGAIAVQLYCCCEFKFSSLLVSAVRLYCVLLRNCTRMVDGWVVGGWMVLLLLYSCTADALPCCYSRPPPPARPVDRAVVRAVDHTPLPSPGRRWPTVVDRPPSPGRSLARRRSPARSLARPPSFVRLPAVVRPPPLLQESKVVLFSTGGAFLRRPRPADLGAACLVRRGIKRGPACREPRPRPRPVARAARSQNRKNRVSFAGRPSGSAGPSRQRETRAAREDILEKKRSVDPIELPCEQ